MLLTQNFRLHIRWSELQQKGVQNNRSIQLLLYLEINGLQSVDYNVQSRFLWKLDRPKLFPKDIAETALGLHCGK